MKILIIDDHSIVRHGVKQLLKNAFPAAVFGEADTAAKALTSLRKQAWSVVILDIELPGRNGLDLLPEINSEFPKLPVLILSIYNEQEYAIRSIRSGAAGYITKDATENVLAEAIKIVLRGGKYISASTAQLLATEAIAQTEKPRHEELSDREYQVLRQFAMGSSAKEIALKMSLSVNTIRTYRSRILDKLGLKSTSELIRYAIQHCIVE